jgi:hypothetical protein
MNALETERLTIRPFTLDDLHATHRLLGLDLKWAVGMIENSRNSEV